MPHFVIDCSESVLGLVDPAELMQSVYEAAESTKLFAGSGVGGIKVRLNPYGYYVNVDAHEHFVHVFAYVMEGRTREQKQVLARRVIQSLKAALPEVDIISMNIADFERATYSNAKIVRTGESETE